MKTISGFTIVRNAEKLDYPFRESVRSLAPLCDEIVINCGESDDGTLALCQELQKEIPQIKLIQTSWSESDNQGGNQLKVQSDRALAECTGDWCFYLQADEVLHEEDYASIRKSMELADLYDDVDGLAFDYRHFYVSYDYEIRGRNWYRREVRAFKNGRGIEAFRDAQGFRKSGDRLSALLARARVFHYGYVRSESSLLQKSGEMARLWGNEPDTDPESAKPRHHVGLRRYRETHPEVMVSRIQKAPRTFNPKNYRRVWDRNEIKNAITLLWESIVPYRIGEFRNYELVRP